MEKSLFSTNKLQLFLFWTLWRRLHVSRRKFKFNSFIETARWGRFNGRNTFWLAKNVVYTLAAKSSRLCCLGRSASARIFLSYVKEWFRGLDKYLTIMQEYFCLLNVKMYLDFIPSEHLHSCTHLQMWENAATTSRPVTNQIIFNFWRPDN
jgi:hypothetical protein